MMKSSCLRCGRPISSNGRREAGSPRENESRDTCGACTGTAEHFDATIALWLYEGLVRQAVVSAKYGTRVALADALGRFLAERMLQTQEFDPPDLITVVPTHPWRRLRRGDGGVRVIAKAVQNGLRGGDIDAPLREILRVTRSIRKQAHMGENERKDNVSGAFAVRNFFGNGFMNRSCSLKDRRVLLVDDVMTTGATANEVARVLKMAGARHVTVGVVARAV